MFGAILPLATNAPIHAVDLGVILAAVAALAAAVTASDSTPATSN